MKSLAIIPARGGSTRLKDKNIYPINGKPLIAYTIEAVINSNCFNKIIVSTDSKEISKVANQYDVEIHDRPNEYAGSKVTVLEAILNLMNNIEKHDILAYFLPTCPFRNSEDIEKGMALLDESCDSVISMVQYDQPPQLAMVKNNDFVLPIFDNLTAGITNSKYITKYYKPNGGYYIGWWDKLLENRNFFTGHIKGYEIPKFRSVDIDDIYDIYYAELILKNSE